MVEVQSITNIDLWVLILIALWVLPWKGYAMWTAAKKSHKKWFIVLLILNTLAILDILYIFIFSKKFEGSKKPEDK
ncbi:DUF5652 family protein [Patescibacteria group bacterium]